MNFIKILYKEDKGWWSYLYDDASNVEMYILGNFLRVDASGRNYDFFKRWAVADKEDPKSQFTYSIGGDETSLEEEDGYVYLESITSREENPVRFKIPHKQFVQMLDEWQEKVLKLQPKEVIIKHENDQFFIETSN